MPIYDYRCEQCGYQNSYLQKLNEQPLIECPKCGGKFKKLVCAPAIKFKGSGFYITDYKNNSSTSSSKRSEGSKEKANKSLPDKGSPNKDTLAS